MCGIVGAAGLITNKGEKVFRDLLIMDQLRGFHSTGVVAVHNVDGAVKTHKKAVHAQDFLDMKSTGAVLLPVQRVLIGHNRWATKGAVTSANAHPFSYGAFHGVHNGTLISQYLLPDSGLFDVDSENIYYAFDKIGVRETYKKINGAAALVWYDERLSTLNMLRNDQRPLYYAFTKDHKTVFWASEGYMLMAAMERQGLEWDKVLLLPVNKWLAFNIQRHHYTDGPVIPQPKPVKLQPYVPPPRVVNKTNVSNFPAQKPKVEPTPPKLKEMGYEFGESVEFVATSLDGSCVTGVTCDDKAYEVRIQCYNSADGKQLFSKFTDNTYGMGKVTGFMVDKYLCIAYNSVDVCEYVDGNKDDDTIVDHLGNAITKVEFDKRYKQCSFCTATPDFDDKELIILDHDGCLCGDCAVDKEVLGMCNLT